MRRRGCIGSMVFALALGACGAQSASVEDPDASGDAQAGSPDATGGIDAGAGDAAGSEDAGTVLDARDDRAPAGEGGLDATSGDAANDAAAVGALWASPSVPAFDAATIDHVRQVRATGQVRGNRGNVFAKIGDSITARPDFLTDLGLGRYDLGQYGGLSGAIAFYSSTALPPDQTNSFSRVSDTAVGGWRCSDALGPPDSIALELGEIHPAYAIVMFGTNDLETLTAVQFQPWLDRVLVDVESAGTVAILSTIPDRVDFTDAHTRVLAFNDIVRGVASAHHAPLVDLFVALDPLPGHGLSSDGVHPSSEPIDGGTTSTDFTTNGLTYGYAQRNLIVLQILDRLRGMP
jgi:hypothetical protein